MMSRLAVLVNALVVFQAFFITVLTVMSVSAYRRHSALRHIVAVSVAHVGFILVSVYNIYTETLPTLSWRVLLLLVFYALSDYSIFVLLKRGHYVDFYERLKAEGHITEAPKPVVLPRVNGGDK